MKNLSPLHAESRVSWLAHTASACLIDEFDIRPAECADHQAVGLSGGNQLLREFFDLCQVKCNAFTKGLLVVALKHHYR